jgi:hypothetical protein
MLFEDLVIDDISTLVEDVEKQATGFYTLGGGPGIGLLYSFHDRVKQEEDKITEQTSDNLEMRKERV